MPVRNYIETVQHPLYRNAFLYKRDDVIYTHIRVDGKKYRQTTKLSWTHLNYEYALKILEKRLFDIIEPGKQPENLQTLFNSFIAFKEKSISFSAKKKYLQSWNHWIKKSYSTADMSKIKLDVMDLINASKLNQNTIHKSLQLLSSFFNYLLENKFIDENPVTKSMLPKIKRGKPVQYTKPEILTLINHFRDGSEMNLIVRLAYNTGMRINEMCELKKGDIYTDRLEFSGKGGFTRIIPILENTELAELCEILKRRPKPIKYLIPDYPHTLFKKACEKLKIRNLGFHGIRKYYENYLLDLGVPPKTVASILGHTVAVQSKNYVTVSELKELQKAMQKVNVST